MTSRRPRILVAEPEDFCTEAQTLLKSVGSLDLKECHGVELHHAFQEYDVIWFRLSEKIDSETLGPAPRAKIIATPVTGIDHIDLDACAKHNIQVVCLKGEREFLKKVRATAEHTIGLTMALMRKTSAAQNSVRKGEWTRDLFRGNELYEKTAGIIGMGRLGSIVADYFHTLGMKVIATDIRPFEHPHAQSVSLETLLESSDIVSLHVDYSEASHHLIGANEFKRMKNTAVFINTSRGGIADEKALLNALTSETIAGAALDVLAAEPNVPADHPLIQFANQSQNLIITPHIGGNTFESFVKTEIFIANRVIDALTNNREN
ncbi:MAG: hypothetical protein HOI23_15820 [Deltaproteobacteria bacterium]|jgi:D-3-phosphoglycerate dehydrogenase / 2-oxoglutarate reductase|nr:hypothetical protein [Deltaproteobacteria bacterium]MBT6432642.1 hypothetical protein [Deltaproteobacteria bacterium]